jgi:hypothetical protein
MTATSPGTVAAAGTMFARLPSGPVFCLACACQESHFLLKQPAAILTAGIGH